ncbi:O-antigen ligase [Chryseobacterium wangxinyae]|uniref:O-antigen polymerase n=1 Tax=Chryseobacterium sp. CY350 TaxID=2997336 RepID=UPI0022FD9E80|nr:O-antigen polymerase [Chryseobacterium sp. CY350]WBZ97375.1 O-antigen ligase [Chryseobacterium sp. CY350]
MRLFLIFILIVTTLISFSNLLLSANILLWVFILFLGYNVIKDKYVSLASIFIFGFIYIYFKEILNNTDNLIVDWGKENVEIAFQTILFSAITFLSGYYFHQLLFCKKKIKNGERKNFFFIKNKKSFFKFNLFLTYLIFFGNIVLIIKGLTEGRQNAFEYGILSSISYAVGVICIVNYKYYFKQFYGKDNYIKVILYSLPIFILYIGSGTRFLLLFGIIALINSSLFNLKLKKIAGLGIVLLMIGLLGNFFLQYRNIGIASGAKYESVSYDESSSFNQKVVSNFTEEGVFRNAAMITDYTKKNDFTYGKSFSFLLYFWIPRVIWTSKPTQIDFWLIREYTDEYDESGHSTASGFLGEIYMDFGKYLTVIVFFLIGILLSKLNEKLLNVEINSYFILIVSSSVIAWLFFAVRSIVTSSIMMIFIILLAYIFSKLLKKWNLIK